MDGQTDIFFLHIFPGVDSRMNTFWLAQAFLLLSQAEPLLSVYSCRVQTVGVPERDTATHPAALGVRDVPVVLLPVAVQLVTSGWPGFWKTLLFSQARSRFPSKAGFTRCLRECVVPPSMALLSRTAAAQVWAADGGSGRILQTGQLLPALEEFASMEPGRLAALPGEHSPVRGTGTTVYL